MTPIVTLRGVEKHYTRGKTRLQVLQKLDLDIQAGDFLALMGPSGSGKTTLLNLIAGLDEPDAGTIDIAGTRIDQLRGSKLTQWRARHVGFVFQFYNLIPTLTAAKNVELPLLLTALNRNQRAAQVDAALRLVALGERATHKPSELSGGQQQRVGIARALVSDPMLLVCDEPTGDLDRQSADEILGLLQILNREHGKTIIMVTHDQKAADYASRQLHMDKGRLIAGAIGAWEAA
jgi:putative ABC transport system ATP-binding protein